MNKIEIPSEIKYRIKKTGNGPFQPQYKKGLKRKNCMYPYYDERDGDTTMCNKSFGTLEEAEKYVENLIKQESTEIFYKDNWK
jgi:hypothetical protein